RFPRQQGRQRLRGISGGALVHAGTVQGRRRSGRYRSGGITFFLASSINACRDIIWTAPENGGRSLMNDPTITARVSETAMLVTNFIGTGTLLIVPLAATTIILPDP